MVRRVAEYPIRDTILVIVSNLLTTNFLVVFLFRKNRSKTMKSKIILVGAILCAITTTGAHAVTKCVALNSSSTRCTYENTGDNVADWTSTCTTNGVSTPIKGIGICSANAGSTSGATATGLEISSTADKNKHCWCKMTSPAVSRWVFYSSRASAGICAQLCANGCANRVQSGAAFRSAMLGSLSD